MGTLFGREIVLSMRKKYSRRTRLTLRSIISNSKYSYQPEDAKKKKKKLVSQALKDLIHNSAEILLTQYCRHNNVGKKNGENEESWNHLYGDVTLLKDFTNKSCGLLALEISHERPRNHTFSSCLCQRCNIANSSSSNE